MEKRQSFFMLFSQTLAATISTSLFFFCASSCENETLTSLPCRLWAQSPLCQSASLSMVIRFSRPFLLLWAPSVSAPLAVFGNLLLAFRSENELAIFKNLCSTPFGFWWTTVAGASAGTRHSACNHFGKWPFFCVRKKNSLSGFIGKDCNYTRSWQYFVNIPFFFVLLIRFVQWWYSGANIYVQPREFVLFFVYYTNWMFLIKIKIVCWTKWMHKNSVHWCAMIL